MKWLQHFLSNYENTVIVISHDRYFLDSAVVLTFLTLTMEKYHITLEIILFGMNQVN